MSELPCVLVSAVLSLTLSLSSSSFSSSSFLGACVYVCAYVCVLASVPFTGDQSRRSTQPPSHAAPSLQLTISSKHLQSPPHPEPSPPPSPPSAPPGPYTALLSPSFSCRSAKKSRCPSHQSACNVCVYVQERRAKKKKRGWGTGPPLWALLTKH